MTMRWSGTSDINQCTEHTTARAHLYYYVKHVGHNKWIAGRFTFNREIDFTGDTWKTAKDARAYCEEYDNTRSVWNADFGGFYTAVEEAELIGGKHGN